MNCGSNMTTDRLFNPAHLQLPYLQNGKGDSEDWVRSRMCRLGDRKSGLRVVTVITATVLMVLI